MRVGSVPILIVGFTAALASGAGPKSSDDFLGRCKNTDARFSSIEGGCKDGKAGLVWSLSAGAEMIYEKAARYCSDLEDGPYNDWELPAKADLVDVAMDRMAQSHFAFPTSAFFWARTSNQDRAHVVILENAEPSTLRQSDFANVTCSRKGSQPGYGCPAPRKSFITASGGCKSLEASLIYSQVSLATFHIKKEARTYCDDLTEAGQTDWRLATAQETSFYCKTFRDEARSVCMPESESRHVFCVRDPAGISKLEGRDDGGSLLPADPAKFCESLGESRCREFQYCAWAFEKNGKCISRVEKDCDYYTPHPTWCRLTPACRWDGKRERCENRSGEWD